MDPQRIVELIENTHDIQTRGLRSLREIDRRALNAMVLVKRHGNALAGYGVIASAFREQAAKMQMAAEVLQHAVEPLVQSAMRQLQTRFYLSSINAMRQSIRSDISLGVLPETARRWDAAIAMEQRQIHKILADLLSNLDRFQEGIAEQEYIVTNARIEAALVESSGVPLSRVSQEMGNAVAEVREAITLWKRQLEEFAHESSTDL